MTTGISIAFGLACMAVGVIVGMITCYALEEHPIRTLRIRWEVRKHRGDFWRWMHDKPREADHD